jgi:hypothetical protein
MKGRAITGDGSGPPSLDELASQINDAYVQTREAFVEALGAMSRSVESAITVGRLLIQVKQAVPYGGFQEWVQAHCRFGVRTAQYLMRYARQADDELSKTKRASFLGERVNTRDAILDPASLWGRATELSENPSPCEHLEDFEEPPRDVLQLPPLESGHDSAEEEEEQEDGTWDDSDNEPAVPFAEPKDRPSVEPFDIPNPWPYRAPQGVEDWIRVARCLIEDLVQQWQNSAVPLPPLVAFLRTTAHELETDGAMKIPGQFVHVMRPSKDRILIQVEPTPADEEKPRS